MSPERGSFLYVRLFCAYYAIGIDADTFEYEDMNIICKIIYDEFPDLDTISYRQSLEHEFEFCIKEYNKAMAELNKD